MNVTETTSKIAKLISAEQTVDLTAYRKARLALGWVPSEQNLKSQWAMKKKRADKAKVLRDRAEKNKRILHAAGIIPGKGKK